MDILGCKTVVGKRATVMVIPTDSVKSKVYGDLVALLFFDGKHIGNVKYTDQSYVFTATNSGDWMLLDDAAWGLYKTLDAVTKAVVKHLDQWDRITKKERKEVLEGLMFDENSTDWKPQDWVSDAILVSRLCSLAKLEKVAVLLGSLLDTRERIKASSMSTDQATNLVLLTLEVFAAE